MCVPGLKQLPAAPAPSTMLAWHGVAASSRNRSHGPVTQLPRGSALRKLE